MEPGVLIDLRTRFITWALLLSGLHRETELLKHTIFASELSTWKKQAPFIHPSLLNKSISFHPLYQSFCPVRGYLLDRVSSHRNANFIKLTCWRTAYTSYTKASLNEDLTIEDENKTRMMTQVLYHCKENDSNNEGLGLETWKTGQNPWIFYPILSVLLWKSGHEGALLLWAFYWVMGSLHWGTINTRSLPHSL